MGCAASANVLQQCTARPSNGHHGSGRHNDFCHLLLPHHPTDTVGQSDSVKGKYYLLVVPVGIRTQTMLRQAVWGPLSSTSSVYCLHICKFPAADLPLHATFVPMPWQDYKSHTATTASCAYKLQLPQLEAQQQNTCSQIHLINCWSTCDPS